MIQRLVICFILAVLSPETGLSETVNKEFRNPQIPESSRLCLDVQRYKIFEVTETVKTEHMKIPKGSFVTYKLVGNGRSSKFHKFEILNIISLDGVRYKNIDYQANTPIIFNHSKDTVLGYTLNKGSKALGFEIPGNTVIWKKETGRSSDYLVMLFKQNTVLRGKDYKANTVACYAKYMGILSDPSEGMNCKSSEVERTIDENYIWDGHEIYKSIVRSIKKSELCSNKSQLRKLFDIRAPVLW